MSKGRSKIDEGIRAQRCRFGVLGGNPGQLREASRARPVPESVSTAVAGVVVPAFGRVDAAEDGLLVAERLVALRTHHGWSHFVRVGRDKCRRSFRHPANLSPGKFAIQ